MGGIPRHTCAATADVIFELTDILFSHSNIAVLDDPWVFKTSAWTSEPVIHQGPLKFYIPMAKPLYPDRLMHIDVPAIQAHHLDTTHVVAPVSCDDLASVNHDSVDAAAAIDTFLTHVVGSALSQAHANTTAPDSRLKRRRV